MDQFKFAVRLFESRGLQAIRWPKGFRLPGKAVKVQHVEGGVLMTLTKAQMKSFDKAARTYQAFLRKHPDETAAMEEWESAPLGIRRSKPAAPAKDAGS
jgi:virulence-associated protein VagC